MIYEIAFWFLWQVYIVAMGQEHERQARSSSGPEEESEDMEDPPEPVVGESLLSLVQPEMVTLSKHWLAALKDHALLSLPSGTEGWEVEGGGEVLGGVQ